MHNKIDFSKASSTQVIAELGKRLEKIRLERNTSRGDLAEQAGVSSSTLARFADGHGVSLDSFVRILQALNLSDALALLLPDPGLQPIQLLQQEARPRKRASRKTSQVATLDGAPTWQWGKEDEGS